jgi:DNA-binding response OmpR family regulator
MAPSNTSVLIAESPAIRRMIATALELHGFAPVCCEPEDAEAELRTATYRILITNSPVHVTRDQIPTVYLADDDIDFLDDLPPQARRLPKPFGVDQLMEVLRALLMVHAAARRTSAGREPARQLGRVQAGG